jgi:hypothetical protein
MKADLFAKAGAVAYVFWGLLHFKAAQMMFVLGESLEAGMLQARIFQNGWNLVIFAGFAIVIAIHLNWKNSCAGYWLNLWVISAADIGFIYFVLMPGHVPMIPGAVAPILWIVALALTTVGYLQARKEPQAA